MLDGSCRDRRQRLVPAPPEDVFAAFSELGGPHGWLFLNSLWKIRGLLDGWLGGPGLRGRPAGRSSLREGDEVDFWRVERVEHAHLLRLRSEMRMPGAGWLEFEVTRREGGSLLQQTATFVPRSAAGLLYWYALLPAHHLIFAGLSRRIAARAAGRASATRSAEPRPA